MARFSLPKLSKAQAANGLPFIALFLCLGLFAMAGIVLVGANSEPVTGQSAYVTGVSAQGYQGLKRLLIARGHPVAVNRDEDGPARARADLEIITLDGDNANLVFGVEPGVSSTDDDNDDKGDGASASSDSAASASASDASAASAQSASGRKERTYYPAPDPKRANHILYHPLGKVVLVVAPKWSAGRMMKHPLWDVDPDLIPAAIIKNNLEVLAPASETVRDPLFAKADDLPPLPEGRARIQSYRRLITFDIPAYDLKRDTRPKTAAEKKADQVRQTGFTGGGGDPYISNDVPVRRPWSASGGGLGAYDLGAISGLQSMTAPNLQPVMTTQDGRPILSRLIVTGGRRQPVVPVYVLSEPDLLNNTILADPQRTANALNLIEKLAPKPVGHPASIVFNLTFAGMGFDHDLLHTLARPPYIAAPLCLLLMGLVLMWAAFSRFGPPLPASEAPPLGRGARLLADNAARLFALTMKQPKLAGAYAQHVRDMVLKSRGYMQVSSQEPPDELADRIGRAHGASDSYLDLKARADKTLTVHQLIDITRRLHAWKTEIDRAHI
ncbi:MAG: hypothetical protein ACTHLA_09815 [Asticcacaulis sp.]|uniref:hypothetical protein n=1 Tax=Asticcacaulis sp. TaxID=1872648 RepID=UPI003F7C391C